MKLRFAWPLLIALVAAMAWLAIASAEAPPPAVPRVSFQEAREAVTLLDSATASVVLVKTSQGVHGWNRADQAAIVKSLNTLLAAIDQYESADAQLRQLKQ